MWFSDLQIPQQAYFMIGSVTGLLIILGVIMLALGKYGHTQNGLINVDTAVIFVFITAWTAFLSGFLLNWWVAVLIGLLIGAAAAAGAGFLLNRLFKSKEDIKNGNKNNNESSGFIEASVGPFANKEEKNE